METDQNQEDSWRERASETLANVLLVLWAVLLIPWLPFAALAGMAFDGGNRLAAALFVLAAWSYGPAVFAAFKLLDRSRKNPQNSLARDQPRFGEPTLGIMVPDAPQSCRYPVERIRCQ